MSYSAYCRGDQTSSNGQPTHYTTKHLLLAQTNKFLFFFCSYKPMTLRRHSHYVCSCAGDVLGVEIHASSTKTECPYVRNSRRATLKHTGPQGHTGPSAVAWLVSDGRPGRGATSTEQCRLHQIKACQSSARRTPSADYIRLKRASHQLDELLQRLK